MKKLIKIAMLGVLVANFNIITCSESEVGTPKIHDSESEVGTPKFYDNGRKLTEFYTKEQGFRTKGAILARLIAREKAANPVAKQSGYKFDYPKLEKEYLKDLKQLKQGGQKVKTTNGTPGHLLGLTDYSFTPLHRANTICSFLERNKSNTASSLTVEDYKKCEDEKYTDELKSHLDIYYAQVKPARVIKPTTSWNRLFSWFYRTK